MYPSPTTQYGIPVPDEHKCHQTNHMLFSLFFYSSLAHTFSTLSILYFASSAAYIMSFKPYLAHSVSFEDLTIAGRR